MHIAFSSCQSFEAFKMEGTVSFYLLYGGPTTLGGRQYSVCSPPIVSLIP